MSTTLMLSLLVAVVPRWCFVHVVVQSFQVKRTPTTSPRRILASLATLSVGTNDWLETSRDMQGLVQWAKERGIVLGKGVSLRPTSQTHDTTGTEEYDDDWNVGLDQAAESTDRILFIPRDVIFNSTEIQETLLLQLTINDEGSWENAVEYIQSRNCHDQLPQFCLWIRILQEFERGNQSSWFPWIQSLPRTFTNALYMDEVELEDYLPPYAWSLAKLQLLHLQVFPEALKRMPTILSAETLHNHDLHKWALSVVFTRCWGVDEDEHNNDSLNNKGYNDSNKMDKSCHIAPIGDMLNHAENATTFLDYDEAGNCNIFLKRDVPAANVDALTGTTTSPSPLSLSYGKTTNPSRFLVLYGFVDTTQPRIFSQILVTDPSQQHKNLGYSVDRMTLDTHDGSIAPEIWDVTLYSILDQIPSLQSMFYSAHQNNDTVTIQALHRDYRMETGIILKRHMNGKAKELEALLMKMDQALAETPSIACLQMKHPRFFLIRKHNAFMYQTFAKAEKHLDTVIQRELEQRKKYAATES
jgi:hypothetical protein